MYNKIYEVNAWLDIVLNENDVLHLVSDEGKCAPISVEAALAISGMTASELVGKCYPSKTPHIDAKSGLVYHTLRMYFGEGTGMFWRGQVNHEVCIAEDDDNDWYVVVSTQGGFPICYVYDDDKNHRMATFNSKKDAIEWIRTHPNEINASPAG